MRHDTYIWHVTMTSGHGRESPRSEVSDETLAFMAPWLKDVVESGEQKKIPGVGEYSATATQENGALVMTIFAHEFLDKLPLFLFGVAARNRQARKLWDTLVLTQPGLVDCPMPDAPMCAVVTYSSLGAYPDVLEWAGDFERIIAWTWLEIVAPGKAQ